MEIYPDANDIFTLTSGLRRSYFRVKDTVMRDIWFSRINHSREKRAETLETLPNFTQNDYIGGRGSPLPGGVGGGGKLTDLLMMNVGGSYSH